jgi:hypothetical protein
MALGRWRAVLTVLVIVIAALSLLAGGRILLWPSQPQLTATYHAVVLTNGQVFFARVEQLGSPYSVLTDIYYLQRRVDAEARQASPSLVKTSTEMHEPDRMFVNSRHILFIEPVSGESQIAKLIEQMR